MTRGTHQVGAFAAALGALAFGGPALLGSVPIRAALGLVSIGPVAPPVSWPTLAAYLIAALLGGTAPDLDKPRNLWARILTRTAFGGHRHLSHSLVGLILATGAAGLILGQIGPALQIAPALPLVGFATGYLSHLLLDSLTIEGVPWLFPIPLYLGLPPWSRVRVKTGTLVEQLVVTPSLLILIGWIGYHAGRELIRWWR